MDKMVTHEFVHKNQEKLVMDLDFYQFGVDGHQTKTGKSIHSQHE